MEIAAWLASLEFAELLAEASQTAELVDVVETAADTPVAEMQAELGTAVERTVVVAELADDALVVEIAEYLSVMGKPELAEHQKLKSESCLKNFALN